jgi:hypothetical protein
MYYFPTLTKGKNKLASSTTPQNITQLHVNVIRQSLVAVKLKINPKGLFDQFVCLLLPKLPNIDLMPGLNFFPDE